MKIRAFIGTEYVEKTAQRHESLARYLSEFLQVHNNILIDSSDKRIKSLIRSIDCIRACVSQLKKNSRKRPFNNETYITDRELSERLKISRRTLQEWRYNRIIPYVQIASKILYRERDVQQMLEKQMRNVRQ